MYTPLNMSTPILKIITYTEKIKMAQLSNRHQLKDYCLRGLGSFQIHLTKNRDLFVQISKATTTSVNTIT